MTQNESDIKLFEAVKSGNESAFEILFKLYYSSLCAYSNSIVKDNMAAEEIVSDFLMKIWINRSTIDITTTVKGYFTFSVRNRSLNFVNASKKPSSDLESIELTHESNVPSPLDALVSVEILEEWEEKINQLPAKRRKIFRMNKFEGKSHKEIAKELSLSTFTVRNHIQLALRSLANLVILIIFFRFF